MYGIVYLERYTFTRQKATASRLSRWLYLLASRSLKEFVYILRYLYLYISTYILHMVMGCIRLYGAYAPKLSVYKL